MTLFRSYNADPASLPDNYIKSIQEDYKGNLWILTGVGYAIYNSESETFNREVHAWLCEVGIDGTPALVYIDHNKNMWFYIKGKGCYLYIPESQLLYPLLFDTHQLPEGDITDIVECREGILLVYNTGRLVCLDTRTNKIKWQQDDLARELGTDKQGIFTLFVDRDNDIWMYSPFGIWVYSPEQKKWLSWLANIIKRRSHNMVRAVSQDKQGRIWIGTDQDGIDILDKKTGEVRQLRNKAGDERSLQNNTVMVLYEDSSETMWVGTYKKGISYFNECAFKFGAEYMGDISCIEEDKEGYVWLGINDVGIIYWNSVTGNRAAFPQKGTDKLITDAIVCILKASDGKLWIGTLGGGLICYDNGRIIHYKKNIPERQNSLAHNNVLALAEDKQGIIWIGTLGRGVPYFDLSLLPTQQLRKEWGAYIKESARIYTLGTSFQHRVYYNQICRFLNSRIVCAESMREQSKEKWERQFKRWLMTEGIQINRKSPSPYSKDGMTRNPNISYLLRMLDFTYADMWKDETEKDVWELDNLSIDQES